MTGIPYLTLDVFTATRFGGNPLAVIPDARGLDGAEMQRIATEFNYSESTFVLPPEDPAHTAQVRIFTPTDEIPFAGHPNVGTAYALARAGTVFGRATGAEMMFEETAGLVAVRILEEAGMVVGARIRAPRRLIRGSELPVAAMAACAGLDEVDVVSTNHAPLYASVGLPFGFVELSGLDALARARPSSTAFAEADAAHPSEADHLAILYYVRLGADHLRARMFAPLSNIPEDPATGSAAAALAGLLADLRPERDLETEIVIDQGIEMGRPSRIEVSARKSGGNVEEIWVGGRCVPMMRGTILRE